MSDTTFQLVYGLVIFICFITYGVLVRSGRIKGRGILWAGLLVGLIAMAASTGYSVRLYQKAPGVPVAYFVFYPFAMALVSLYCVLLSYRTQLVQDLATYALGDTKVIVRQCLPSRIPDAMAMVVPTNTALRMTGMIGRPISAAAGPSVEKDLAKHAPTGVGKVIATDAGKLAVGKIYHVAVYAPAKPFNASGLIKGIDSAAIQARKHGAESVVVPLGAVPGLKLVDSMKAIAEGALRQRRAFGELVFVVFDSRDSRVATEVVRRAVEACQPGTTEQSVALN